MEWMKELLTTVIEEEEKVNEFLETFKKEFPKHAVIKTEFNTVNNELKETKAKLDETAKLMEDLKAKETTIEEYQTKVSDWENKYKEFESQAEQRVEGVLKRSAVKDVLSNKMPKSAIELLLDKIDYTEVKLTDKSTVANEEKLVEKFKEEYSDLFIQEKADSKDKGGNQGRTSDLADDRLREIMGLPVQK